MCSEQEMKFYYVRAGAFLCTFFTLKEQLGHLSKLRRFNTRLQQPELTENLACIKSMGFDDKNILEDEEPSNFKSIVQSHFIEKTIQDSVDGSLF